MAIEDERFKFPVTPSTGLLIPRGSPNTLITPAFDKYFRNHERMRWELSDIPFDQIDRSLVTADQVTAVRWAMLIESHNPVVTADLLTYYRPDHEGAADAIVWGYEEFKHYLVERTYLQSPSLADLVDLEDLDRELTATRAGEWGNKERGYTPLQIPIYRGIQEVATGRYYYALARHTEEPVLKGIATLIAKDEIRHSEREFDKAEVEWDKVPRTTALEQADEVLLGLDMPGLTFIPDYQKYKEPVRRATNIGVVDVVIVLRKISALVGKTHMLELAGRREFRDKVIGDYNLDPKEVLKQFVLGRGNN